MFIDDYAKDYKTYELVRKNLINNGLSITKYSMFNLEVIGNILAKIATTIEKREFIFKSNVPINDITEDFHYESLNLIIEKEINDGRNFSTQTYPGFYQHKKKLKSGKFLYRLEPYYYNDSKNIFELNKERRMTWFKGYPDYNFNFSFYFFNISWPELKYHKINFQNFPYLDSFINYIIDYRIQNKKEEISEEELMELANQFLSWYLSENKSLVFKPTSKK